MLIHDETECKRKLQPRRWSFYPSLVSLCISVGIVEFLYRVIYLSYNLSGNCVECLKDCADVPDCT